MFRTDVDDDTTTIYFVALATVCSVAARGLFSQSSELWSEVLSWVILPILLKGPTQSSITAKPLLNGESLRPTRPTSLWLVAIGLAIASCYRAELGIINFWPILTPLLLAVQTYTCSKKPVTNTVKSSWFFSLTKSSWGATIPAIFALTAMSNENWARSATSSVAVVAMLFVFVALSPRAPDTQQFLPLINNVEEDIPALSRRLVLFLAIGLGMQTYTFGFIPGSLLLTLLLSTVKSSTWFLMIRMTRHVSWAVATLIGTFSLLCSLKPSMQSSDVWAFLNLFAGFITLGQIIYFLPQQSNRHLLWLLFLVPLIPYLMNNMAIQSAQFATYESFSHNTQHPVQILVENAVAEFENLVRHQSKSYDDAYHEYQRRFAREPPDGFKTWFDFAISHGSPVIDEFDTMYESISSFWKLSGQETLEAMNALYNTTQGEVWKCKVSSSFSNTRCTHPHRTNDRYISLLFTKLLSDLNLPLPDLTFLVNHLDEPRVVLPPHLQKERAAKSSSLFNTTILSHQRTWDRVTKNCAFHKDSEIQEQKSRVETYGLPFVTDFRSQIDLCQHPEYSLKHGLFMSPTSFRLVEGIIPLLSTGSLSTMSDILFPSPAYSEEEFQYNETYDIEWEAKTNNLYWAGSTSGGYAMDDGWRWYHRQRFVELAQNLVAHRFRYLREAMDVVTPVEFSFLNTRQYDVAFTKVFQCEKKYCRDQMSFFNIQAWTNRDRALRSRLVFDIDGNGISGRYYKLLASKSVPLKQTLFREWHDDRLKPWVHYVPVSQSMEELPELVAYLTSNPKGQQIARDIAERGRDWFSKAFRQVDQSVYLYRLMLELASLQNPRRQGEGEESRRPGV